DGRVVEGGVPLVVTAHGRLQQRHGSPGLIGAKAILAVDESMVPTGLRHDTAQASVVERAVLPTKRLKAWLDQELRQLFPARRGNGLELLGHEQLYGGYAAGHLHPVLL